MVVLGRVVVVDRVAGGRTQGSDGPLTLDLRTFVAVLVQVLVAAAWFGLVGAPVRVEKVTEAREDAGGLVGFLGIRAAALRPPPPALARRVECIGDSIMCGAHSERVINESISCFSPLASLLQKVTK